MERPESGIDSTGNDTFQSFLESQGVQFLHSRKGNVPVSTLDEKRISLFFSGNWCRPCKNFTPQLVQIYNELRNRGENLEIISISFDTDESSFSDHVHNIPWLALPIDEIFRRKLCARYQIDWIPALIPVDLTGKPIGEDAVQLIDDFGVECFPFSSERREELKALDEAKRIGSDFQALLVSGDRDYVVAANNVKVPVSNLTGKTIGLYFAADWCPPCRAFTVELAEAYNELKITQTNGFEVIFVSTDRDEDSFDRNFNAMPWMAIPFGEKVRQELCRIFALKRIPTLVILGPDGKALMTNGRPMISLHGAKAFPFTESRVAEIEETLQKEGEGLARQIKDPKHNHMLKLDMAKAYICNFCRKQGKFWTFSCKNCDFDLHPRCAIKDVIEQ